MKKSLIATLAVVLALLAGCQSTPEEAQKFIDSYNSSKPVAKALAHYEVTGSAKWSKAFDEIWIELKSKTQTGVEYTSDQNNNVDMQPCYDLIDEYRDFTLALGRYSVAILVQGMDQQNFDELAAMMADKDVSIKIDGNIETIDAQELKNLAAADTAMLRHSVDREMIITYFSLYEKGPVIDLSSMAGLPNQGFAVKDNYALEVDGDSCTVVSNLSFPLAVVRVFADSYGIDNSVEAVARYMESHPQSMYEDFGHFIVDEMGNGIRTGQSVESLYSSIGCTGVRINLEDTDNHSKASFTVPLAVLFAEKAKAPAEEV